MAEAIGVVSTAVGLAEFGFGLSVKLYTFSQAVSSAASDAQDMSNEVSLTSTVIRELAGIIESDRGAVVSPAALEATKRTVDECLRVFHQIDATLSESLASMNGGGRDRDGFRVKSAAAWEKLMWPWRQKELELLRCNLDRLKASLTLMLQVLSYGRDISHRRDAEASLAYQQHVISNMAKLEKDMNKRYAALEEALRDQGLQGDPPPYPGPGDHINMSSSGSGSTDKEPSRRPPHSSETTGSRLLSEEVILCLKLLDQLVGRSGFEESTDGLPHQELTDLLDRILSDERRVSSEKRRASFDRLQAVRSLHTRLLDLAGTPAPAETSHTQKKMKTPMLRGVNYSMPMEMPAASDPFDNPPEDLSAGRTEFVEEIVTIEAPTSRQFILDEPATSESVSNSEKLQMETDRRRSLLGRISLDMDEGFRAVQRYGGSMAHERREQRGDEDHDAGETPATGESERPDADDNDDDQHAVVKDLLEKWTTMKMPADASENSGRPQRPDSNREDGANALASAVQEIALELQAEKADAVDKTPDIEASTSAPPPTAPAKTLDKAEPRDQVVNKGLIDEFSRGRQGAEALPAKPREFKLVNKNATET